MKIPAAIAVIAFAASCLYLIMGYKKNAAKYYKCYAYVFALSEFVTVIGGAASDKVMLSVTLNVIAYSAALIMAAAEDIGKIRSYLLFLINFLVHVFFTVFVIISLPGIIRGGTPEGTVYLLHAASNLILSAILGVMTAAKYKDKDNRNTE